MISRLILSVILIFSLNAQANVLGEMQTFAPNTDGLDFITVHSARPLNEGYFAFSNYFNFAKDHLLVYEDFPKQNRMPYSSHLIEYDFGITYAITRTWQVSLMAPFLLDYYGETKNGIHVEITKGAHAYRPGTKWTFYENQNSFAAALLSVDIPTVVNSPYTGIEVQPITNLEIAYSLKSGTSNHGYNLGYRKRLPTETPADAKMFPLRDQVTASYGYSRDLTKTSRFIFELFGSAPVDKEPYEKASDASSIDALFGVKHFWWKYLRFDWGVTVAPPQQTLSPTWRVFAGLVYYWKNEGAETESPNTNEQPGPPIDRPALIETADFSIEPEYEEIYTRSSLQIDVIGGGKETYRYEIESGPGSITDDGLYTAPTKPGKARIKVSDNSGKARYAEVKVITPPKADKELRLTNLNFITGKEVLIPSSKKWMDKNLATLKGLSISKIIVEGHTDSVGSDASNLALSRRRANFVRNVIIREFNLPPKSVIAMPFGESTPLMSNETASGRQQNRRVELKVYFKK